MPNKSKLKPKSFATVWSSSGGIFDLSQKRARIEELDAISQSPNFWDDSDEAQKIMQERGQLVEFVDEFDEQMEALEEAEVFVELAAEADDDDVLIDAKALLDGVRPVIQKLELRRMFGGDHDDHNAIVSVNAGAGGTESQDWAEILLRMYVRYCESKGWDVEITDQQFGEEAGIKSCDVRVEGDYPYGHLKAEQGVHRLVRISPFDSDSRRHTSFAAVSVAPEIDDKIEIDLNESDISMDTYRASGAGGQHVNRTESAVRLTHEPTGVVVACQAERSQHKNRSTAMKILRAKLYERELQERREEAQSAHAAEKDVAFGSQIRSYVLHPYKQIKDLRTEHTEGNVDKVLDGDLDPFIEAFLLKEGTEDEEEESES